MPPVPTQPIQSAFPTGLPSFTPLSVAQPKAKAEKHDSRSKARSGIDEITNMIESLYSNIPRQCKNCGLRFREDAKLRKHMDWHFETNRREKNKAKQAVSRQWYWSNKVSFFP
jgi:hypothetical protein